MYEIYYVAEVERERAKNISIITRMKKKKEIEARTKNHNIIITKNTHTYI